MKQDKYKTEDEKAASKYSLSDKVANSSYQVKPEVSLRDSRE
ncbi:hypothetical protein [Pontibacter chitinilyticus]